MSLNGPWTLSRIEKTSADLVEPVRHHLTALCGRPEEHARFLNTLSLLEHIGSRKILTSQSRGPLDCETLKHLAEEARHAFFFKRTAERVAGRPLDYSDGDAVMPAAARMYFGRLDAGINRMLADEIPVEVPYLYVSMVVELRAIWAYRLYNDVLVDSGLNISLKGLLAEEELHLPQMAERLVALGEDLDATVPAFARLEDALFRGLWRSLAVLPTVH
ncbi:MAG: hypothetical protein JNM75_13000 [Rhodospirillales bacterium]|nr:hypothetical protein [Rhodospirillales bacterium]